MALRGETSLYVSPLDRFMREVGWCLRHAALRSGLRRERRNSPPVDGACEYDDCQSGQPAGNENDCLLQGHDHTPCTRSAVFRFAARPALERGLAADPSAGFASGTRYNRDRHKSTQLFICQGGA
jgi:hypothetical protein